MWINSFKIFLFFLLLISTRTYGQVQVHGRIMESTSNTGLALVTITDSTSVVYSDSLGYYAISVSSIPCTLHLSMVGYDKVTYPITKSGLQNDIFLKASGIDISEVVVSGKTTNLGLKHIRKVIQAKKSKRFADTLQATFYQQLSIQKYNKDSVEFEPVFFQERDGIKYKEGRNVKFEIQHENESSDNPAFIQYYPTMTNRKFKGSNGFAKQNNIHYFDDLHLNPLDIYKNSYTNTRIATRPITSPISSLGPLNYSYKLKSILPRQSDSLLTIEIKPKYNHAPLWKGTLVIQTSDYAITDVQLTLNQGIFESLDSISYTATYQVYQGRYYVPDYQVNYNTRFKRKLYSVQLNKFQKDLNLNPNFSKRFFNREKIIYKTTALSRDTTHFEVYRPIKIGKNQKALISKSDSIYQSLNDPKVLQKQDSVYNSITWYKVMFSGITRRNRAKGYSYGFEPIIQLFRPFGIGGFRMIPTVDFDKEFLNANKLDLKFRIDYGFRNKDLKGFVRVGYTFWPKKFGRIYGKFGDTYDFITFYQSLDALISRGNYVRNIQQKLGYSMEISNGIYMNTSLRFSDKQSIDNLSRSPILDSIFGTLNIPISFKRYKAFVWETDFIIKFKQDYISRGKRKIVIPNNAPTLEVTYKKGFPGIFDSEVNFDYLEANLSQKLPASKIGSTNWTISAGSFLNKKSLRLTEYNYFRGSTKLIFTNPLSDYQLLGPTLSTSNPFIKGHLVHHFNGFLLNKIPLINRLNMEIIAGASSLYVQDQDLLHLEAFVGLGKPFKLWGETVEIACYYLVSDSSRSNLTGEFKIGFNFYNNFLKEWIY